MVDKKFSKPPKSLIESHDSINPLKEVIKVVEVDSDDESSKPLENVIIKELNKKSSDETSPENLNALKNNIVVVDLQINNIKVN